MALPTEKAYNSEMKGILSHGNLHGSHSGRQAPGVAVKKNALCFDCIVDKLRLAR